MTPAERLLAAADLLDKRASEATEGPWHPLRDLDAEDEYCVSNTTHPTRHDDVAALCLPQDARYIATVHPEVGKALAAWLRHEGQGAAAGLGVLNPTLRLADLLLASAVEVSS